MSGDEWMELFAKFSANNQSDLVLVLGNGSEIAVDVFIRFEPKYIVVRGRVAGTDNEGRAFFVPFSELSCLRIERPIQSADVQALYGERPIPSKAAASEEEAAPPASPPPSDTQGKRPTRSEEMRDKLLQRIRTTKSGGGSHSTDA